MDIVMQRRNFRKTRKRWDLFFIALPLIIALIALRYIPLLGWYLSVVEYKVGIPILENKYVGLDNFVRLLRTKAFLRSLNNTLIFSAFKYAFLVLPPLFAIMFSEIGNARFRKVIQTVSTLPYFISWVIIYGLVYALFSTEGPVNLLYGLFGTTQSYMTDKNAVYIFQSLLQLWKGLGWNSIIYVAAITAIDTELYDAASIDGAGYFKQAIHVTVPGLMPTFVVMLLLGVADFVNNGMDQYYVFQNAMIYENIETLELFTYKQGLKLMDYSYATAVGIMKSGVSIVLLFGTNAFAKKVRGESII